MPSKVNGTFQEAWIKATISSMKARSRQGMHFSDSNNNFDKLQYVCKTISCLPSDVSYFTYAYNYNVYAYI